MDKEKDRLAQAYTDRETETAQFILIDTNLPINLGEDGDRRLFGGRLKESLEKNDREIRFCRSCLLELQKHLQSADPEKARKAACGLQFVIDLYTQGHLAFYEDGGSVDRLWDEGFADPFTKDAALALFQHGNVLVITNDDGLAWDLLSQRSVKSRYRLHVAAVSSHASRRRSMSCRNTRHGVRNATADRKPKRTKNGGDFDANRNSRHEAGSLRRLDHGACLSCTDDDSGGKAAAETGPNVHPASLHGTGSAWL